jgi:RNA polymerase sigma-70 factor (ECF subfamily)
MGVCGIFTAGKCEDALMAATEREQVLRVLSGDRTAYGELIGAYQGMVFAVALNITGNRSDSEDVLQDAFLRAYEKLRSLSDPSKFGPWLHTITRHTALRLLRERYRIPVVESEDVPDDRADPDALTPAEEFAKAELSRSLWAHVAELPPKTREAILLYYMEGFSIKGAAAFLGISAGAMKMRLDFGREKLREVLTKEREGELHGQRPAKKLHGMILAALPIHNTPVTTTSTLGTWTTLLTAPMSLTKATLAITFVVAILLAGNVQNSFVTTTSNTTSKMSIASNENESLTAASGVQKESLVPPVTPLQASAVLAVKDPAGQSMCVCEVILSDATPVSGAKVTLESHWRPNDAIQRVVVREEATTNDRGEVRFDGLPKGNYYLSAIDGESVACGSVQLHAYTRQRLVLQPAQEFAGRVRDDEGNPIAAARLLATWPARSDRLESKDGFSEVLDPLIGWYGRIVTESDDAGIFSILLPRVESCRFYIFASGFATLDTGKVAISRDARFTMEQGETVSGRVLTQDSDKPVSGVRITIASNESMFDRFTTESDKHGKFAFTNLPDGPYSVATEHAKFAMVTPDLNIEVPVSRTRETVIHVAPGASISGKFSVANGARNTHLAPIAVVARRQSGKFARTTTPDANGAFRFSGLSGGEYNVRFEELETFTLQGDSRDRSKPIAVTLGKEHSGVDFTLIDNASTPSVVRGHVVDANGSPVPRAFVNARVERSPYSTILIRADDQGAYMLGGLPVTGHLKMRAFVPGLSSVEKGPLTVGVEGLSDVDFVLEPTGSIAGKVATKSGKPFSVSDTYVELLTAWDTGIYIRPARLVLVGGAFRIPDLPAGKYELYIDLPQYRNNTGIRQAQAIVEVKAGQNVDKISLDFDDEDYAKRIESRYSAENKRKFEESNRERERNSWSIDVQVVDAITGKAISEYDLMVRRMGMGTRHVKDPEGRYTVEPGEGPSAVLTITAPRYARNSVKITSDEINDGAASALVQLVPGAVVEGIVVDSDDKPIAGARVYPYEMPDESQTDLAIYPVSDSNGVFRLDSMEIGLQTIWVEHPAYALRSVDVSPVVERATTTNIILSHGGRIEGIVTLDGKPVVDATASCRVDGREFGTGRRDRLIKTDATGHYLVENVRPGDTYIAAILPKSNPKEVRGRLQRQQVSVQEGEVTRADFSFEPADASIHGTITTLGQRAESPQIRFEHEKDGVEESLIPGPQSADYDSGPLPAGEIDMRVSVRTPGGTLLTQKLAVDVAPGESAIKDIDFEGKAVISGEITGLHERENATVAAFVGDNPLPPGDSPLLNSLLANAVAMCQAKDGTYRLEGLTPGTYTIRALPSGWTNETGGTYRAGSAVIAITGDEETALHMMVEEHR